MNKIIACLTVFLALLLSRSGFAETVPFTLLTHDDNVGRLPQPTQVPGVSGDHLLRTADDPNVTTTWNPNGCFSFNFMNRWGVSPPDYPEGYAEAIHSMEGTIELDISLSGGGTVAISSLYLHGQVNPTSSAYQYLVELGDPATDGNHGPVDGQPNSGLYQASAAQNWAFEASFDWYYDTPYAGAINMTFNDFLWDGFIIPVSELTPAGMAATALDDPLGYFGGTSDDFESWLQAQVGLRLPEEAVYLLFAQGEAHPVWTNTPGMSTSGIVGETSIAWAVPEPVTAALFAAGLCPLVLRRRGKKPR